MVYFPFTSVTDPVLKSGIYTLAPIIGLPSALSVTVPVKEVVASAQTALQLELGRYQTGIDPYINVVTLQTTLLTDQRTLVDLQIQQMTSAVQLVEALGGGWDTSQLPTPSQVAAKPSSAETRIQQ